MSNEPTTNSDSISTRLVVRDHSQPCEHEDDGALIGAYEQDGIWFCGMGCPGGRERTFERESVWFEEDDGTKTAKVRVWVEVSDE